MGKRKQQYELEKNLEYGGIEHMRVDPRCGKDTKVLSGMRSGHEGVGE